jgi:two-component system, OmpR family, response regulator
VNRREVGAPADESEQPAFGLARLDQASRQRLRRHFAERAWRQFEELAVDALTEALLDPAPSPATAWRIRNVTTHVISGPMMDTAPDPQDCDVLIVDDDDALRQEIDRYLTGHGFRVHQARDGKETRAVLKSTAIQVVVLDVMLPGEDGLSICRSLADKKGPSILMLSSMGESVDRILGLELGADDYVVKPVTPRELLARIRALLRRRGREGASPSRGSVYAFSGFRLDIVRRQLKAPDGDVLMLTPGELSLLGAFVENPQRVLSRDDLASLTRGESAVPVERAIDIQISRLRRKLNSKSSEEVIKTHRGLGYILDTRVTAT